MNFLILERGCLVVHLYIHVSAVLNQKNFLKLQIIIACVFSYRPECLVIHVIIVINYNCHKLLLLIIHYKYYLFNAQVKLQVQTAVSRNLEALRNREVWLLNQVELLQSAKDEVLSRQQAKLHKLLGIIQTQKGGTTLTR